MVGVATSLDAAPVRKLSHVALHALDRLVESMQLRHAVRVVIPSPRPVVVVHAGKHGDQAVIVACGDRIELVVVAACAADREPEKRRPHVLHHLVEAVQPRLPDGRRLLSDLRGCRERRGDEESRGRIGAHGVAGELLKEKTVVRQVFVEGVDHPVAVGPGMLADGVVFVAPCVGVANDVEPVLGPAFAVSRRSEQPVDEGFNGLRALVGDEGLDLLRCGR